MSMNLDIRYWFPKKPDALLAEMEEALDCLKKGLGKLGVDDTEPFIRIAITALIQKNQPDLDYPSDNKRKRLAKLNNLKKAIGALNLELRIPLKEMYGLELPNINPEAVEAYISDESQLDPDERHPPKENRSLNDSIARQVLPLIPDAKTYPGGARNPITKYSGTYRKTVALICNTVGITVGEDHSCRDAIKPPAKEADSIAAQQWRDDQIDKETM